MATTGEMHKGWRGVRGDLGKDAIVSAAKGNNSHKHKTIENFYFVLKKKKSANFLHLIFSMGNGERQKEACLEAHDSFDAAESKFFLFFDRSEHNSFLTSFSFINLLPITECVVVFPGCSFSFSACSFIPSVFPSCAVVLFE